ncbi:MAG: protease modulator HflC [Geminicoccaceae bacterium]|nr:protease modulator HflC [Geminicoccaceae bacterium]
MRLNRNLLAGIGVAAAAVLLLLWLSVFTVHQTMQALVLQFGEPIRVVQEPGLHLKLPILQQVEWFEKRVLDYDAEPLEVILGDQKRLVVDTFARYRIIDPLRFRQSVGTERDFLSRLESITNSTLRNVLGEASLFTVLSEDRTALMGQIRDQANRALQQFGVNLVDVRIKRADLPPENSEAIYKRMRTEREREAKELRAQGAEIAQRIRARADRERRVLIADAQRDAEVLRGEGDAEAVKVFGQAFGRDPAFFDFYRSMQAYKEALGDDSTSIVMSPDNEFFRFFGTSDEPPPTEGRGQGRGEPQAEGAPQGAAGAKPEPPAPASNAADRAGTNGPAAPGPSAGGDAQAPAEGG